MSLDLALDKLVPLHNITQPFDQEPLVRLANLKYDRKHSYPDMQSCFTRVISHLRRRDRVVGI